MRGFVSLKKDPSDSWLWPFANNPVRASRPVCVCVYAASPVYEADNGEVVCVKCVKGRAGSSSAVIHLYFRAEPRSNRHLTGEREKIHCRHLSHSYETTQRKCSASRSMRFSQQENKKIKIKSIICSIFSVFFSDSTMVIKENRHSVMCSLHLKNVCLSPFTGDVKP